MWWLAARVGLKGLECWCMGISGCGAVISTESGGNELAVCGSCCVDCQWMNIVGGVKNHCC